MNRKGGSSIAVQKQGGWDPSFRLACKLANWTPDLVPWISIYENLGVDMFVFVQHILRRPDRDLRQRQHPHEMEV